MITDARYIISSPDVKDCPPSTLPEYAFIGRSNVGKSSLINMLCHNPKLAKTSQKPGKTLLINHFLVQSTDRFAEGQSQEDIKDNPSRAIHAQPFCYDLYKVLEHILQSRSKSKEDGLPRSSRSSSVEE